MKGIVHIGNRVDKFVVTASHLISWIKHWICPLIGQQNYDEYLSTVQRISWLKNILLPGVPSVPIGNICSSVTGSVIKHHIKTTCIPSVPMGTLRNSEIGFHYWLAIKYHIWITIDDLDCIHVTYPLFGPLLGHRILHRVDFIVRHIIIKNVW